MATFCAIYDQVIVRTATRSTLKVAANLTQILNFQANFYKEFELFCNFQKNNFMLTMIHNGLVDTLRLLLLL